MPVRITKTRRSVHATTDENDVSWRFEKVQNSPYIKFDMAYNQALEDVGLTKTDIPDEVHDTLRNKEYELL